MHGLICKALEGFVIDQHGLPEWVAICDAGGSPVRRFEAMRIYDDAVMLRLVAAGAHRLDRSRMSLCEDVGHWVCTHPPLEPVRRLFRFSGSEFVDLLHSLDELHERAQMAVPGIDVPRYRLTAVAPGRYRVASRWSVAGGGAVLTGILRAMADDYGTLAMIEPGPMREIDAAWHETVEIHIAEQDFSEGRTFALGGAA
ncbi:heme NO-binding domain-containing protein [Jannaschia sp. S6380]|uniref:heme NO-binding domain-containing protein n=1 Tax=Jannaschia sp. S6380 TaxID=2926408 RepID=UPI001FF15562|nr:heme NO-binding domain-containing protein [Jannaschia sp. S6380]MCK0166139.1 heme NO-binding domain-containing protein [Jannaschia sp. S6380]